jgi:hypothetical protein
MSRKVKALFKGTFFKVKIPESIGIQISTGISKTIILLQILSSLSYLKTF